MNIVVIVLLGIIFAGLVLLVSSLDIPLWTIVLVVTGIFLAGQMVAVYTPSRTRIPVPSRPKSGGRGSGGSSSRTGGSTSTRTETMEDRMARINAAAAKTSQPKTPRSRSDDTSKPDSQPSTEGEVQNQDEIDKAETKNKEIEEDNKGIEDKNKKEEQRFKDDTKKAKADHDAKIKELKDNNEKKQKDNHKKKVEEVEQQNTKATAAYKKQLEAFKKGKQSHKEAVQDFNKKQSAALQYDKEEQKRSENNKKALAKNKKQEKKYQSALRDYREKKADVDKRSSDIAIKGITDNEFIREVRESLKNNQKETSKIKQNSDENARKTLNSHTKEAIRVVLRKQSATKLKALGYDDEGADWQGQISRLIENNPIDLARLTVGVGGLSKNTTPDPLTDQEKRDYIGSAGPEPKQPKPAPITPSSGERPDVPEEPAEFTSTEPVKPKLATPPALKINPVPASVLASVKVAPVSPIKVLVPTEKVLVPKVVRSAPVRTAAVKTKALRSRLLGKPVLAGRNEMDGGDIDIDELGLTPEEIAEFEAEAEAQGNTTGTN
jgi:hypothetical protein